MSLIRGLLAVLFKFLAPHGDPRVHFGFDQLHRGGQAEVAELLLGQQIRADGDRLGVLRHDDAIFDRPQIGPSFPAVEILAVEQLDRFGLAGQLVGASVIPHAGADESYYYPSI